MTSVRSIIDLIQILFSKLFLRSLIFFVIFIYISGFFPWTKAIYDYIFPYPELRITDISVSDIDNISLGSEFWYQRVVSIENRGNDTAKNVYISAKIPWGEITRFEIFSNYPHLVHSNTNISNGYLLINLDHLAEGAEVLIYVWARQNAGTHISQISFDAVHDQGSAPDSSTPSSSEQIGHLAEQAWFNFVYSINFVENSLAQRNVISTSNQMMIPTLPTYLLFTVFVISFLAWLFLDSVKSSLIHGILASVIYWIRIENFFINPNIIILISISSILYVGIRTNIFVSLIKYISGYIQETENVQIVVSDQNWCRLILSICVLISGLFLQSAIGSEPHMLISYVFIGYIVVIISSFL